MDSFWSNIFRNRNEESEKISTILSRIPIFQELSRRDLAAVERILHHRAYKSGESVFFQNDPSAGMYIILKGKVQVIYEPTQQVIAELFDGDFFGELALVDDSPRSATVIARMDCEMLGFFRSDLLDLIERKPKLGLAISLQLMSVISERLRKSNDQVQALQRKLYELRQEKRREATGT